MSRGIDYGLGQTNIDKETGIRYGVIPMHEVTQTWCDSSESDYGPATCGKCGNEAVPIDHPDVPDLDDDPDYWDDGTWTIEKGCHDYACLGCKRVFDSSDAFGDEPIAHTLDDGEYKATQGGDDSDIFILKSPYFTKAQFCSPCAPGACHLMSPDEDGDRAYCFGHDWFDDDKAPYPVYSVKTGLLVEP